MSNFLASGRKSPYLKYDLQIFECIRKGYLQGTSLRKFVKEASTRILRKEFPDFRCSESSVTRIIERYNKAMVEGVDQSFHNNSLDTTETAETESGSQEHQSSGSFEMENGNQQNQTEDCEYAISQLAPFDEEKQGEEEKFDTFQEAENLYGNHIQGNLESSQNGPDIFTEMFPTIFQENKSSIDENEIFSWKDWAN